MAAADDATTALLGLLACHTGFMLAGDRGARARAAVQEAMQQPGMDGAGFLALVQRDPDALHELTAKILVGETYFQREPQQWAVVRETILADLARRRRPHQVIRCWSAGCSSGEEAYSLAILLAETGLAGRARVIGTDISHAALACARAASYGAWSLRTASKEFADRWLDRSGERYVVNDAVRRRVEFACLNLVADAYPSAESGIGAEDLILCRNVLLYFDRASVARVAQKLYAALAPGGWLVCGSSDPWPAAYAPFDVVSTAGGLVYRRPLVDQPALPAQVIAREVSAVPSTMAAAVAPGPVDRAARMACHLATTVSTGGSSSRSKRAAVAAAVRSALDPEQQYLRAIELLGSRRLDDALLAFRRVIYLDRGLVVAHFAIGAVLERMGEVARAVRAYRNAAAIADGRPPDQPARLADGASHRTIALAARRRCGQLAAGGGRWRS